MCFQNIYLEMKMNLNRYYNKTNPMLINYGQKGFRNKLENNQSYYSIVAYLFNDVPEY